MFHGRDIGYRYGSNPWYSLTQALAIARALSSDPGSRGRKSMGAKKAGDRLVSGAGKVPTYIIIYILIYNKI